LGDVVNTKDSFSSSDVEELQSKTKIGLLATISQGGFPHISLVPTITITSREIVMLQSLHPNLVNEHLQALQKMGFLILTTDKFMWRGKALYVGEKKVEDTSNIPSVSKTDTWLAVEVQVVETHGKERLRLLPIVVSSLLTKLASSGLRSTMGEPILEPWAQKLFNKADSLKFASYITDTGYPIIVPLFHGLARDAQAIDFTLHVYQGELASLKSSQKIALFTLATDLEQILVRGTFQGYTRNRLIRLGTIHLEWIQKLVPRMH
jgi:hypothetical protein